METTLKAQAPTPETTLKFQFKYSTKNKHRYEAVDPNSPISEIYPTKAFLPATTPMPEITLVVKVN